MSEIIMQEILKCFVGKSRVVGEKESRNLQSSSHKFYHIHHCLCTVYNINFYAFVSLLGCLSTRRGFHYSLQFIVAIVAEGRRQITSAPLTSLVDFPRSCLKTGSTSLGDLIRHRRNQQTTNEVYINKLKSFNPTSALVSHVNYLQDKQVNEKGKEKKIWKVDNTIR